MEEIANGGSFTEKFGIGSHAEFYVAISRIGRERAAELEPRARRDGALLDDELGRFRFGGNLPRYVIYGGKIRLAGLLRRSSYANEDGFARANGFAGDGSVGNAPCLACGSENFFEVLFVDWYAAGLELGDAIAINVRADDFMSGLRQAGSGNKSDVSTSDDGKTQKKPSLSCSLPAKPCAHGNANCYSDRSGKEKKVIRSFFAR